MCLIICVVWTSSFCVFTCVLLLVEELYTKSSCFLLDNNITIIANTVGVCL
jgi:hypothetical protein